MENLEETKKRLQMIMEYTVATGLTEAGNNDEENGEQQPDAQMPMPPMPDQQGQMPQGADPNAAPNADVPMGGDNPDMGGGNGTEGFNPQPEAEDMTQNDFDAPSEDDDVVDITDLTDSQEKTEKEVAKLGNIFSKVLDKLNDFSEKISRSNQKVDDLAAEFERRNPTQIEKLTMHTAKGEPFTTSVSNFWKDKTATSNYSIEDDENGKTQGQYVITKDDVNGNCDWNAIAKDMDNYKTFLYNQTLTGALGI